MVPAHDASGEAPRSTAPMWTGVASDMREPFGCLVSGVIREGSGTGRAGRGSACLPRSDPSGLRPPTCGVASDALERTRSRYPESRKARIGSGASPWDSRSTGEHRSHVGVEGVDKDVVGRRDVAVAEPPSQASRSTSSALAVASWTLVAERISPNLLLQVVALIEHEVDTGVRCQHRRRRSRS